MASVPALLAVCPKARGLCEAFHSSRGAYIAHSRGGVFASPLYPSSSINGSTGDLTSLRRSCRKVPTKKGDWIIRAALNDSSSPRPEVFQGMYGPWSIDSNDVREVLLYRAGLVTTALAFTTAASRAFLPEDSLLHSFVDQSSDVLYGMGAGGLGVSLLLIHIYVTPIKRALQLLWATGVLGSLVVALKFAAPVDESLVNFVLHNRWAIWLVGPLFASLTGLVFKEGLCYGKLEAAILVFIIPTLLLGHLSGLADEKVELPLLLAWMALYTVFTARKFTQPIKDDLGDKSVFIFQALPDEEKQAFLVNLQGKRMSDGEQQ